MVINIYGKNSYLSNTVNNLEEELRRCDIQHRLVWSKGDYPMSNGQCIIEADVCLDFCKSFDNKKLRVEVVEETFDSILRFCSDYGETRFTCYIEDKEDAYDINEFEDCETYETRLRALGDILC